MGTTVEEVKSRLGDVIVGIHYGMQMRAVRKKHDRLELWQIESCDDSMTK